jgi:hypothetical protein
MDRPERRDAAGVPQMAVYDIPASLTGFAEDELSQPLTDSSAAKSTMGKADYFGQYPAQ